MKNKNKQTKFPVARIKKIMQKDEEVGKVAQATPVVISKALELFLGMIVDEAKKVTMERGSKKIEAYHLKHAVNTTEMLDFLKEIVESVPDPSAGGTVDLEAEHADGKKKRGKGKKTSEPGEGNSRKRRKKKADTEDMGDGMADEPRSDVDDPMNGERDGWRSRQIENAHYRPSSPGSEDGQEDQPYLPRR